MNDQNIPIFGKVYGLYKEFYLCLKSFPRQDRYALGQKCEEAIIQLLRDIILISQIGKQEKRAFLQRTSVEVDLIRIYLRLACEIRALNSKKYLLFQEMLDEIGRMIGGWLRYLNA